MKPIPGSKEFSGLAQKAPPHLSKTSANPLARLFVFSGNEKTTDEAFYCVFRIIELHGKVTAEEFSQDLDQIPGNAAPGDMTLFPPNFRFGRFVYTRADGSQGTGDADSVRPITREQLLNPATPTKAPTQTITPATAPALPSARRAQLPLPPPPQPPPPDRSRGMGRSF